MEKISPRSHISPTYGFINESINFNNQACKRISFLSLFLPTVFEMISKIRQHIRGNANDEPIGFSYFSLSSLRSYQFWTFMIIFVLLLLYITIVQYCCSKQTYQQCFAFCVELSRRRPFTECWTAQLGKEFW